jgi:hypothetical protein
MIDNSEFSSLEFVWSCTYTDDYKFIRLISPEFRDLISTLNLTLLVRLTVGVCCVVCACDYDYRQLRLLSANVLRKIEILCRYGDVMPFWQWFVL